MPILFHRPTYRVEYLCTAHPARPVWRDDDEPESDNLQTAIGRALEIWSRRAACVRVVDEADRVRFQYGPAIAA